jgi:hypothetical protein
LQLGHSPKKLRQAWLLCWDGTQPAQRCRYRLELHKFDRGCFNFLVLSFCGRYSYERSDAIASHAPDRARHLVSCQMTLSCTSRPPQLQHLLIRLILTFCCSSRTSFRIVKALGNTSRSFWNYDIQSACVSSMVTHVAAPPPSQSSRRPSSWPPVQCPATLSFRPFCLLLRPPPSLQKGCVELTRITKRYSWRIFVPHKPS